MARSDQIEKNPLKYLYSVEFTDRFNRVVSAVIDSMEDKDKIKEIEELIKEHLLYCYLLMADEENIKNHDLNKYIDTSNHLVTAREQFIKHIKVDNQNPPDQLFKFSNIIVNQILTIVLLYKKGYLPTMTQSPFYFIKNILHSILPFHDSEDNETINAALRNSLANIPQEIWHYINQKPYSEISIFFWENFDISTDKITHRLISAINTVIEISSNLKKEKTIPNLYCDLFVKPKTSTNYNDYFKSLEEELQNTFQKPDIYFLDSSLISEYKSKGILFPFASIEKRQNTEQHFLENDIIPLGIADNGTLDAFPISRNFHIPAKAAKASFEIEHIKFEVLNQTLAKKFSKTILAQNVSEIKYIEYLRRNGTENSESIFDKILSNSDLNKPENAKFITNIPNELLMPMQLARGPHSVYTLFAYMANCSTTQNSLFELNGKDSILIEKKDQLIPRFEFFYRAILTYVPIFSLTLDHTFSGFVRDHNEKWIDFCLPIEASIFQESKVEFAKKPILTKANKPLSCLGGFVFAIDKDCMNPYKAVEIVKEISKNRTVLSESEIPEFENAKVFQSTILSESKINQKVLSNGNYIQTPASLAKRPNFKGWKELENIISEVTRVNVFVLLLFRNILSKYTNDTNLRLNEISQFKLDNKSLNIFKENCINIIVKDFIDSDIKSYLKKRDKKMDEDKVDEFVMQWVTNNFNFITVEQSYIKDVINELIDTLAQNDMSIDKCIEVLSIKTAEMLHYKFKTYCYFNDYKCFND